VAQLGRPVRHHQVVPGLLGRSRRLDQECGRIGDDSGLFLELDQLAAHAIELELELDLRG
jgi:hypothetical protein